MHGKNKYNIEGEDLYLNSSKPGTKGISFGLFSRNKKNDDKLANLYVMQSLEVIVIIPKYMKLPYSEFKRSYHGSTTVKQIAWFFAIT